MTDTTIVSLGPWYQALNRGQWNTLLATNLGWLFDGFETYALILTVGVALRQLLDPSQFPQIPAYAGTVIAASAVGAAARNRFTNPLWWRGLRRRLKPDPRSSWTKSRSA